MDEFDCFDLGSRIKGGRARMLDLQEFGADCERRFELRERSSVMKIDWFYVAHHIHEGLRGIPERS